MQNKAKALIILKLDYFSWQSSTVIGLLHFVLGVPRILHLLSRYSCRHLSINIIYKLYIHSVRIISLEYCLKYNNMNNDVKKPHNKNNNNYIRIK